MKFETLSNAMLEICSVGERRREEECIERELLDWIER